jgi:dihydrodipicolinate synthase/N-acetylneuraminate lyase
MTRPESNGVVPAASKAAPPPGIYAPTVTIFANDREQSLDLKAQVAHAVSLASAGMTGLVVHGSNGEAAHLSHDERSLIVITIKAALEHAGYADLPLIVGTGAPSVKETVQLCKQASDAGGDYALVLPPCYFMSLMNEAALLDYFRSVADESPLPVLIYNFPGVTQGTDLSSDFLLKLAKHPNIVGVKLTCGNIGKMSRIVPEVNRDEFAVFIGTADALVPALAAGASGAIAGLCNIAPKTVSRLYDLTMGGTDRKEVAKIQKLAADADALVTKMGVITGTKYALEFYHGYGGEGRRPIQPPTPEFERLVEVGFKPITDYEKSL